MDNRRLRLLQEIGSLVCEDCEDSDCGLDPNHCPRIKNASYLLNKYIIELKGIK